MTTIRILGPVDAVVDGQAVGLGGRRQRRVLVGLTVAGGRVVSESTLIDAVWDDHGDLPADPLNTLHQYVSRLRSALGADAVERVPSGYRLGNAVSTDAVDFERLFTEGKTLRSRGDLAKAMERLSRSLDLWRGPAFDDLADVEVVRGEARRLESLRVEARELMAEAMLELGDLGSAAAAAEALSIEQPLSERPVRTLAQARHRMGMSAEAIRAVSDFRRRLRNETGLDPSPEMDELEQRLLDNVDDLSPTFTRKLRGYELDELIAHGAFGEVYRATQPSVGREVAVKVVRAELANDPRFIRQFEVEAQLIARLEHPHIVPLHDYWREPGGAYLVMRLLKGGSAEQRLITEGPFSMALIARMVDEIGGALALAHDAGIVHRDVKPANILFDEHDNLYLADFGIAITEGVAADLDLRSAGSPLYVSPEQIRLGNAIFASDLYAFGVVLYELLTGDSPFPGVATVAELLQNKLTHRLPAVSERRPDVPSSVDAVIRKATEPDPADRFSTMGDLILAFRSATRGQLDEALETSEVIDLGSRNDVKQSVRERAARTLVALEWQASNPYKGLAAFQEADQADFFGRDDLSERLFEHMKSAAFLGVVGPSGSGKSSAVRAGLVPRLRADGCFIAQMVPGENPLQELETALLGIAIAPVPGLLALLGEHTEGLTSAVERCLPDGESELVLVIDQFEELFTLTAAPDRQLFIGLLRSAIDDPHRRLKIVVTLRADFYDRPLAEPLISDLFEANTIPITPMGPDDLAQAIVGPAERIGASIEPVLLAEIMRDVGNAPGALPLLQFALTEIFDRRSGTDLSIEAYRELGGVSGALAHRAESLHEAATEAQQADLRRLFTRLISPGEGTEDTRRRVPVGDLRLDDSAVVEWVGNARLVTFDHHPQTREPTVEVAHEALIRQWTRLRSWLDDDRDGLRVQRHVERTAKEWDAAGRPTSELYRGGRLESIEGWLPAHRHDLNQTERDFIAASIEQRDAQVAAEQLRLETQIHDNRRLRGLLAAAAVLLLVALGAGALALQQRSTARNRADDAEMARATAESAQAASDEARTIAEDAQARADIDRMIAVARDPALADPTVAMLLALEANRLDPSVRSLDALQRSLTARPGFMGHLSSPSIGTSIESLPDGESIVVATLESIDVWNVPARTKVHSWPLPFTVPEYRENLAIDLARNGSVIAASAATSSYIVDLATGATMASWHHDSPPLDVALDPSAGLLAVGLLNGHIEVYEVDNPDAAPVVFVGTATVSAVAWTPDSRRLAAGLFDGNVVMWEVPTQATVWETGPTSDAASRNAARGMLFSSDGSRLITSTQLVEGSAATNRQTGTRGLRVLDATTGDDLIEPIVDDTERMELLWLDGDETVVAVPWVGAVDTFDTRSGRKGSPLATTASTFAAVRPMPDLGLMVMSGARSGLDLVAIDGSGPLSRVVPLSAGQAAQIDETDFLIFGFDPDGQSITTSLLDFTTIPPPPQQVDLASDVLRAVDYVPPDGPQPLVVDGFGPVTLVVTTEGVMLRAGPSGAPLGPILRTPSLPDSVSLSPRGDRVVLVTGDGPLLFDTQSGEQIARLQGIPESPTNRLFINMQFSTNGELLLGFSPGGGAARFDPIDGELIWSTNEFRVASAGSDGTWVAVADESGTIRLLDADTLEPISEPLLGHVATMIWYEVDPSGSLLASWSFDGTVRIWDLSTLTQLGNTLPFELAGSRMNWSPDGRWLGIPSERGVVLWNFDTAIWPDIACEIAGRNLTFEEWEEFGPRTIERRPTCEQYA